MCTDPSIRDIKEQGSSKDGILSPATGKLANYQLKPKPSTSLNFATMKFTTVVAILSAPLLAVAMPGGTVSIPAQPTSTPASSCSTGDLQCCNSVESATDPTAAGILALLGVIVQGVDVVAGLTCDPISVVGISNGQW